MHLDSLFLKNFRRNHETGNCDARDTQKYAYSSDTFTYSNNLTTSRYGHVAIGNPEVGIISGGFSTNINDFLGTSEKYTILRML